MTPSVPSALALLAVTASLSGCAGGPERVEGDLLITADRIFDGSRVIQDGAVVVKGRTIAAVGERGDLEVKTERKLALPKNATLLPGFVDLHVHLFGGGLVYSGVTTVRDVGAFLSSMPPPRETPGQGRILASGPIITVPRGYPGTVHDPRVGLAVHGPAGARRAVRMLVAEGARVIKISLEPGFGAWPMLSADEVRAIVDEAHEHDLPVTAHVSERRGVETALAGEVDELAHMPCECPAALLRELAERDVAIVGTLHVRAGCPQVVNTARVFLEAGGKLLYGSDYGNPGIPPHIDVEELRLLVRAGMTPTEAIASATREAGSHLGIDGLGSIERGAPADLVAVRGNPVKNLETLASPISVVTGGTVAAGRSPSPA